MSADTNINPDSLTPQEIRLEALQRMMPEIFCEGKIDWEKLKATLGTDIDFSNERYVLNWAGKSDAFRLLQKPSRKTLIPERSESLDFDTTGNIFIEGENLEVLKILQRSYFGKVKMIYIDPPYNTGNDSFIYPDDFSESKEEYLLRTGELVASDDTPSSDHLHLAKDYWFKNRKENGHFHSNWLSMMMPRLYLAKSMLREDGVIFISIDDNEVHNLRLLMNEIFGEENFVGQITLVNNPRGRDYGGIAKMHEYILAYTKNTDTEINNLSDPNKKFPFTDNRGGFELRELRNRNIAFHKDNRPNLYYPFYVNINSPLDNNLFAISLERKEGSIELYPKASQDFQTVWRWGKTKAKEFLNTEIAAKRMNDGGYMIVEKYRKKTKMARSVWSGKEDNSEKGTLLLKEIFAGKKIFDFPKSEEMIRKIIEMGTDGDSLILDFFAGSATTAHAVMQLNAEDRGSRRFICVQLPELCDEHSEAYKAGYKTIAEISKERILRAEAKIRSDIETKQVRQKEQLSFNTNQTIETPDLGFKVFKLQDSNFKPWQQPKQYTEEKIRRHAQIFIDPVMETATTDNIVYELLLKNGMDLNSKIEKLNNCYTINNGELMLLLESVSQEIVDAVIAAHPDKVIALDKLFDGNDQLKTNTALQMRDSGVEFRTV